MELNEESKEKKVIRILFRQYEIFKCSTGLQKVCWSSYVCTNVNKAAKNCACMYVYTHTLEQQPALRGQVYLTQCCVQEMTDQVPWTLRPGGIKSVPFPSDMRNAV